MNLTTLFILISFIKTTLTISSDAFKPNGFIPSEYTCEGKNINPSISIDNIPDNTKSLVLIIEDTDAPKGTFDHWVMWNIQPVKTIEKNTVPGMQGKNGVGKNEYTGPCPPTGTHHYHFKVYALDTMLDLDSNSDKKAVQDAMKEHIIASGDLIGLYKKTKKNDSKTKVG